MPQQEQWQLSGNAAELYERYAVPYILGPWAPGLVELGYALKAGQLTYDCRYSTMHGMPVTGGRGFRGLKPLWYNGVPP